MGDTCGSCQKELPDGYVATCNECMTKSCETCRNVTFNTVLAYGSRFLENYSIAEVCKSLEMHFKKEDIVKARNLLREQFGDLLDGTSIMTAENRKGSYGRSAMHANALDVVQALDELSRLANGIQFAVLDITSLPVVRPQSGDTDIDERVIMMENAMRRLQERVDQQESTLEMISVKDKNETMMLRIDELQNKVASFEKAVKEAKVPCAVNQSYAGKVTGIPRSVQESAGIKRPMNDSSAGNVGPSTSAAVQPRENDWQEVKHKKKRKPTEVLQGQAKDTNIKAGKIATPDRDFWISNVDLTMDDKALQEFIENGGSTKDGKLNLRLFERRYKDDFTTKCFRITIGAEDYKRVYNSEFWPDSGADI